MNYGIYVSSKFAQQLNSHDTSKIEQNLKTTPPPNNRGPMTMVAMLTWNMIWCAIILYDVLTHVMSWCVS